MRLEKTNPASNAGLNIWIPAPSALLRTGFAGMTNGIKNLELVGQAPPYGNAGIK